MKILFISNLFPDTTEPTRGLFNARLVKFLGRSHEIRVVAPRPTRGFPFIWLVKRRQARDEDKKFSPVFPPVAYIPKVGSYWNHKLMAHYLRDAVSALRTEFAFDAVLATWAYPDCSAVARLAKEMNFPFVAVIQGSDANSYLKMPVRRRIIVESLNQAYGIVPHSRQLERTLREAGVINPNLRTIYNGVEHDVFQPGDRQAARAVLNIQMNETVLLFIGNLLPVKNPLLLVNVHAELLKKNPERNCRLLMIGGGLLEAKIKRRVQQLGTSQNVSLLGRKPPAEVARHIHAADLLCVSSDDEGVPNVIYEAFACGRRVVATGVGGIPEILNQDFLGRLVQRGDVAGMAKAILEELQLPEQSGKISDYSQNFSWEKSAAGYVEMLTRQL